MIFHLAATCKWLPSDCYCLLLSGEYNDGSARSSVKKQDLCNAVQQAKNFRFSPELRVEKS